MLSRLNTIFFKWNFFYKKYISSLKKISEGFYVEPTSFTTELLSNNVEMVFWLLDLQKEGFHKKQIDSETLFNMEWELIRGEHNYIELHGDISLLLIDYDINKFNKFLKKNDVFFKNLLFKYLNKRLDCNNINNNKLLTDILAIDFSILSEEQKSVLCVKYEIPDLTGQSELFGVKNKLVPEPEPVYSNYKELNKRTKEVDNQLYNELNAYINLFGFDRGIGLNVEESFISFSDISSRHARFKYLPTIVDNIDSSISLEDNIGFSDFLNNTSNEDLLFLYLKNQLNSALPKNKGLSGNFFFYLSKFNTTVSKTKYMDISSDINSLISVVTINNINNPYIENQKLTNKICFLLDYRKELYAQLDYSFTLKNMKSNNDLSFNKFFLRKLYLHLYNSIYFFNFQNYIYFHVESSVSFSDLNSFGFVTSSNFKYLFFKNYILWRWFQQNKTYYFNQLFNDHLLIDNWYSKMKELFLLKADVGANWGFFLLDSLEEKEDTIDSDMESYSTIQYKSDLSYKTFVDNIYKPLITNPGTRPYKWVTIPEFQYSPFFFFLSNLRSFWFLLYNCSFFGDFLHQQKILDQEFYHSSCYNLEPFFVKLWSSLLYIRYINEDDTSYNTILKYFMSPHLYNSFFNEIGVQIADFSFWLDQKFKMNPNYAALHNLSVNLQPDLPSLLQMNSLLSNFDYLLKYSNKFLKNNYGADWLLNAEKRNTDQLRFSLVWKIGLSLSHFNFFSFMSPEFNERSIYYKGWMRDRALDKVPDPEHPLLILDFYRPHTYDLSSDITLYKYKTDLLHLITLGFNDIVFDKDIFIKNYYGSPGERRNVFEMPEYAAPFFFFDSDINKVGSVPTTINFEGVSAFGIPSLERTWQVEEFYNTSSDEKDDLSAYIRDVNGIQTLWRKDQLNLSFTFNELSQYDAVFSDIQNISNIIPNTRWYLPLLRLLYEISPYIYESSGKLDVKQYYDILSFLGKNNRICLRILRRNLLYFVFIFGFKKSFFSVNIDWVNILIRYQGDKSLDYFIYLIKIYNNTIINSIVHFENGISLLKDFIFFLRVLNGFVRDFFVFSILFENTKKSLVFSLKCKSTDINVCSFYYDAFKFSNIFTSIFDLQDSQENIENHVVLWWYIVFFSFLQEC